MAPGSSPVLVLVAVLALTACGGSPPATVSGAGPSPTPVPRTGTPELRVTTIAEGLRNPWDLGFLPDGRILVTERPGRISLLSGGTPGAARTPVAADLDDVYARGEGGLMGLVVHPDFASSRRFTTCQTHSEGGRATDVRLVTWQLSPTAPARPG